MIAAMRGFADEIIRKTKGGPYLNPNLGFGSPAG
jgi:hypothetical protein